jgi:hypothetical protein
VVRSAANSLSFINSFSVFESGFQSLAQLSDGFLRLPHLIEGKHVTVSDTGFIPDHRRSLYRVGKPQSRQRCFGEP